MSTKNDSVKLIRPKIIAHRGSALLAPENTMIAFEQSNQLNIMGMECDVQLSKDEIPVLFHDKTLKIFGLQNQRIDHYFYDELQQFDASITHQENLKKQTIPKFESFLLKFIHQKHLFIEIKSRPWDIQNGHSQKLIRKVISIIENQKLDQNTFTIMSFDPEIIKTTLSNHKGWKCIQLFDHERPANTILDGLVGIGLDLDDFDESTIVRAQKMGYKILGYTCNTDQQAQTALKYQFHYLVSDDPPWLMHWLEQNKQ